MGKVWLVVLGLTLALVPGRASASELNFEGMGAHSIVTIDGDIQGSFYAGEIDWMWSVPTPAGFSDYLYTYCVDILHELEDPQEVRVSDTTDPEMITKADEGGAKAAWLLNTYAAGIHAAQDGIAAAALQVAIWEAITDNTLDLTSGSFILKTTGEYTGVDIANQIFTTAAGYLVSLPSPDGYQTAVATWLDATTATGGGQDQITTPEPSSLMLLGIAGLFVKRRKKTSFTS